MKQDLPPQALKDLSRLSDGPLAMQNALSKSASMPERMIWVICGICLLALIFAEVIRRVNSHKKKTHMTDERGAAQTGDEQKECTAVLDAEGRIIDANQNFRARFLGNEEEGCVQVWNLDGIGSSRSFWKNVIIETLEHGLWEGQQRTHQGQNSYVTGLKVETIKRNETEQPRLALTLTGLSQNMLSNSWPSGASLLDKLTGLSNRRAMKLDIEAALVQAQGKGESVALVVLDLDRFTDINSVFGDSVGDKVLCFVAEVMKQAAAPPISIARTGGDEFVLLIPQAKNRETVAELVERVLQHLGQETFLGGLSFRLSASAGIAMFPKDGRSHRSLMQCSGLALLSAKEKGRGQFQFFSKDLKRRSEDSLKLELDLRRGMETGELVMHYQPQVHMRTGACIGMEALLRWQHPSRGLILPGGFVPMAQDVGLNASIDQFALNEACRQIAKWRSEGYIAPPVSVNLSISTLLTSGFVKTLKEKLTLWSIPPGALEIEVIESVMFPRLSTLSHGLDQLRGLGVRLTIDDFGTGYSSLAMLKDLPVGRIKIDRRFIENITEDIRDDRIVAALIGMCANLGLSVVAEGVETPEQKDHLMKLGCLHAQGFLFGHPLSAEDFTTKHLHKDQLNQEM